MAELPNAKVIPYMRVSIFWFIVLLLRISPMKKLVLVPALALMSLSVTPVAQASNVAQSLCEYVSVDDKKRLRSFLKSNKLKIRAIFDGVQCNGKNLLAFASDNNSVKTGAMMINKLPKKTVKTHLATITSSELAAAANKRVAG